MAAIRGKPNPIRRGAGRIMRYEARKAGWNVKALKCHPTGF